MNEIVMEKIKRKINETILHKEEVQRFIQLLSNIDDSKPFALGIVVGRLYNAFYYQTKRILNREPTEIEFTEFLEFIKEKKPDLENLW
ncbi:MAG: hypothetical protein ITD33_07310 [Nitrosarchaeum sp.]|jgi:hypothetical protein|nr:hypothetical protein [Nitrosarchaeum sp.]MBP0120644.1 hypothetical protein [Nitrosarchaeum sp.]MBP0134174.1 hypothetical protein [Nitrosarchaeum sp.]MDW7640810.1 hypothetical protein [Nitrosarchaeum sp.]MSV26060.1 hypothetical protein [Nitrosarchaeum sp.]